MCLHNYMCISCIYAFHNYVCISCIYVGSICLGKSYQVIGPKIVVGVKAVAAAASHILHSALQQLASQLDNGREQLPQHVVTMVAEKCLLSEHTSRELLQLLIKNGNFPSKCTHFN